VLVHSGFVLATMTPAEAAELHTMRTVQMAHRPELAPA
jgi:hypothetical protein